MTSVVDKCSKFLHWTQHCHAQGKFHLCSTFLRKFRIFHECSRNYNSVVLQNIKSSKFHNQILNVSRSSKLKWRFWKKNPKRKWVSFNFSLFFIFSCECDEGYSCVLTDNRPDMDMYMFHCRAREASGHMFRFPNSRTWYCSRKRAAYRYGQ